VDDGKQIIIENPDAEDSQIIIQKSHNLSTKQIRYLKAMLSALFGSQGILKREQEMDIRVRSGTNVLAVQNININGQNITNEKTEIVQNGNGEFDYGPALDEVLKIGIDNFRDNIYAHAVKRQGSQIGAANLMGVVPLTIHKAMKRRCKK